MRNNTSCWNLLIGRLTLCIFLGLFSNCQIPPPTYASDSSFESMLTGLKSPNCRTRYKSIEAIRKYLAKNNLKEAANGTSKYDPMLFLFLKPLFHKIDEEEKITPVYLRKIRQTYKTTEQEIPLIKAIMLMLTLVFEGGYDATSS